MKNKAKLRLLPAFVSLSAGLVISIVMLVKRQDSLKSLILVLSFLLGFYIVGLIFRAVILACATKEEPKEEKTEELEDIKTENEADNT